jgi:general secretion pathway protein G
MDRHTATGRQQSGFSLMELLVVLVLIALLAAVVTPVVTKSIPRAKESTLKENLFIMRKAIDDYYADKQQYPESLQILVEEKYLRYIPDDPITETRQQWATVNAESEQGGIIDVHSESDKVSSEGTPYNQW